MGKEAKLGIRKPLKPRAIVQLKDTTHTQRSAVSENVVIPVAPFYGSRVVTDIPLDDVFAFVNETALFKGQWQFKQGRTPVEQYKELVETKARPMLADLKSRSKHEQLLAPKVVYGYFPCQSSGNDLIVYEDDLKTERLRFTF